MMNATLRGQSTWGRMCLLAAVLTGLSTASARSEFDFDPRHIPVSYITRNTDPVVKSAGNVSATNVWLGAEGRIELSVTLQDLSTQVVFAQGSSVSGKCWELLVVGNKWRMGYKSEYTSVGSPAANTRYDIVCERKDGKLSLIINGETLIDQKPVDPVDLVSDEGLTFFQRKNKTSWNNCPSTMKFHSAKVYNSGVLVADFVPFAYYVFGSGCLRNTVDGTEDVTGAFFYDWDERAQKINTLFCNEGTDAGGAEVDWVASSGNEFLQTDVIPASTDIIRMKLALLSMDDNRHHTIFSAGGAFPSGSRGKDMELLCLSGKTWRPSFDTSTGSGGGSWTTNVDYEIEFSGAGGLKVDGTVCGVMPSSSAAFTTTYGISFFSRLQLNDFSSSLDPLSCAGKYRFYWAKVYAADGTTLKADFVPYVDGNGHSGLKDKVSGKVFLPLFGRLTPSNGARPQAVYVVPGTTAGDDTNAGTARSPFRTFGEAYVRTVPGGTVYLKDGTYPFGGSCLWLEGDCAHAIVGASGDPSKVVIDGRSTGYRVFCSRNQSNAAFRNLTFRNCRSTSTGAAIYSQGALIENCVFTNNEVAITDNSGVVGGIVYANGGRVNRCLFRDNRATGNSTLGSAVLMTGGAVLENSVLEGNVSDGPEGRCCTVYIAANNAAVIRNCTFVKNRAVTQFDESTAGVRCDSPSARIINTVFCGNEHGLGTSLMHSVARLIGCDTSIFVACAADQRINAVCRTINDGVFADWAAGDYAPHELSRLVNFGSAYLGNNAQPADYGTDFSGSPRFVGEGIDVGAYEWQGRDPTFGFRIIIR